MKVAIIGSGYVGLTTGVVLAYLGHKVVCVDNDFEKIGMLRQGMLTIYEPGLEELYKSSLGNITFTASYERALQEAEIVFITVGTPSNSDGAANLKYICDVAENVGWVLKDENVVVVSKSTVPIGSGNLVKTLIHDSYKIKNGPEAACSFHVVSNPEFLKEGSAIFDTLYPDRIVIGSESDYAAEKIKLLYKQIINQSFRPPEFIKKRPYKSSVPVIVTDMVSAELIKYSANAFLALKIGFINEIAMVSEKLGADILHVAEGIGSDNRIGPGFLNAGIGWGGSCFGKDTAALCAIAKECGLAMDIIDASRRVNYGLRDKVIDRIQEELKIVKGKTVGILGLAFKPNTDDLRDSPAIDIARKLIERGAKVKAYDPVAMNRAKCEYNTHGIQYMDTCEDLFHEADAIILATEWEQFREIDWQKLRAKMKNPYILDGRNFLDRDQLVHYGYKVKGVGR